MQIYVFTNERLKKRDQGTKFSFRNENETIVKFLLTRSNKIKV